MTLKLTPFHQDPFANRRVHGTLSALEDDAWMRTANRAWCWCTTG